MRSPPPDQNPGSSPARMLDSSSGPIHTGRGAGKCCLQKIEHTVCMGVFTQHCQQHQRICVQICMQICRVLCELGLRPAANNTPGMTCVFSVQGNGSFQAQALLTRILGPTLSTASPDYEANEEISGLFLCAGE